MQLRLISWNLHGTPFTDRRPQRMTAAAAEMARRAPDLVLLQEVWFGDDAAVLTQGFGSDYDPIDVPAGALFGRKGGLLAFVRKSSQWSRSGADSAARFEEFRTEANPLIFWQGDGLGDKGIQTIELHSKSSGERLFVLNTHLQAQYGTDGYVEVRRAQIGQLAEVAAGLDSNAPLLAAGDLNTRPEETALYGQLSGVWHDLTAKLRRQCGCGTTIHEPGSQKPANEWIDYILAHRGLSWTFTAQIAQIGNTAIDEPFSDHHGLDATIDIRKKNRSASSGRRALAALVLQGPSSRRAWLTAAAALLLDSIASASAAPSRLRLK